jgi:phosphoglycerate dehydrogenase-like enzyme
LPEVTVLLPGFIPLETVAQGVGALLPGTGVFHDFEFGGSDSRVLVVTTFTRVDGALLGKMPNLKFVQVASTGYDNVDLGLLKSRGITLSNIPVANKESVAEHVIMMSLALLRDLVPLDRQIKEGSWPELTRARELKDKVFAIVGMGAIGSKLAERLLPFEVSMVYYDAVRRDPEFEQRLGLTFYPLDDCLKVADLVSIHLPLTEETKGMFSKEKLALMKEGSILINTSRAEIVDEAALVEAVRSGRTTAGIDVFPKEPPDFSSELFRTPGIIFSPHSAGATVESQGRFLMETMRNVLRYLQGVEPLYRVD